VDHEIFDLVSELQAAEGKDTSFYSWLEVSPSASANEISRAYKKKSIQLHPDKNPGVKNAHDRFARLGVIGQILRNKEARERYDFFYKNGVPIWRGTGYYYSRYRPGLGSVFIFLITVTSGLHYVIQRINYQNDLKRIEKFVRDARLAAWGPKMIPQEGKKKVKVAVGGRAYRDEEGNVYPAKQLDMIVEGGDVYILEPDGQLLSLDDGAASPPSIRRTWFVALVLSIVETVKHRASGKTNSEPAPQESPEPVNGRRTRSKKKAAKVDDSDDDDDSSSEAPSSGAATPAGGPTLRPRGPVPTSKAGGRRRKAPPPPRKRQEKKEAVTEAS